MAFDASRAVTVLTGGFTPTAETWEWDGTSWTSRAISGPSARYTTAMAFDSARGTSVLFGGQLYGGSYTGQTWELAGACNGPAIATQPASHIVCATGPATLTVGATGTGPLAYGWRENGDPINTSANPSAATATLLIATPHNDQYDCVVTNSCGIATSNPATLTRCLADYDCSGAVAVADIFEFLSGWFAGDPGADVDGNGISVQDIFDFLAAWFASC
jgi:hypothetical protein